MCTTKNENPNVSLVPFRQKEFPLNVKKSLFLTISIQFFTIHGFKDDLIMLL